MLNFLKRFVCSHKYDIVDAQYIEKYDSFLNEERKYTQVLYKCDKCNKFKTDEIDGNFAHTILKRIKNNKD